MSVGEVAASVLDSRQIRGLLEEKCQTRTTVINASCEFCNPLECWPLELPFSV